MRCGLLYLQQQRRWLWLLVFVVDLGGCLAGHKLGVLAILEQSFNQDVGVDVASDGDLILL